jgi:hypothetical protein
MTYPLCSALLAAGCLLLAAPASAATYHVAPGGSDGNSGSAAAPWATLQHAADTVRPGDTVLVHDGTYRGFQIETDGTASSPIVFRALGPNVVVNEENPVRGDHHINVEGASYVVIEGFRVRDADVTGIRVVLARGVVVRDNVIGPNGRWGILTGFAPEVQILDNVTYGSEIEHGIYVSNSDTPDDDPVIRGNVSYGNGRNGIQLNGDCYAGGDGVIEGALIENNVVYDNTNKGLSIISAPEARIQNNVIYENGLAGGAGGIHLVDEPGCGLPTDAAAVVNNTIVEPRIAGIRMNDGASGNVVFNNVVVSNNPIADEKGLNTVDGPSNLTRTTTAGLFVNAGNHEYHPAPGSPALDIGRATYAGRPAPAVDFLGVPRPLGAAYDAGAYEGTTPTSAGPRPTRLAGPTLEPPTPNPFAGPAVLRYALPEPGRVMIEVFDARGRTVATLVDALRPAGPHAVRLDGAALPSGRYFARLRTGGVTRTATLVRLD